MQILGIDIGGSGVKGAPVDVTTGNLVAPRLRLSTPEQARPKAVAETVVKLVKEFQWQGPIGIGFPAVVSHGITYSAANVHKKWIGLNAQELFSEHTGCPVVVVNDADAAGIAEMTFGAGQGRLGVVFMITIGTGLGSALFMNGVLVPNTEMGHLEIDGQDAEWAASDAARKRERLSWKKWAGRFNKFLLTLERLFTPDLFLLGGGVSKEHEKYLPYLTVKAEVQPARLLNDAGMVGAALAARDILAR
jgi:polyphosphate glucokinase